MALARTPAAPQDKVVSRLTSADVRRLGGTPPCRKTKQDCNMTICFVVRVAVSGVIGYRAIQAFRVGAGAAAQQLFNFRLYRLY